MRNIITMAAIIVFAVLAVVWLAAFAKSWRRESRPLIGTNPMSNTERSRRHRARQKQTSTANR